MQENLRPVKRIYYRGHVIEATVPAICYTIFGTRPQRTEIACVGSSGKAMQWIDGQVARSRSGGFTSWGRSAEGSRDLAGARSW